MTLMQLLKLAVQQKSVCSVQINFNVLQRTKKAGGAGLGGHCGSQKASPCWEGKDTNFKEVSPHPTLRSSSHTSGLLKELRYLYVGNSSTEPQTLARGQVLHPCHRRLGQKALGLGTRSAVPRTGEGSAALENQLNWLPWV